MVIFTISDAFVKNNRINALKIHQTSCKSQFSSNKIKEANLSFEKGLLIIHRHQA